MLMRCLSDELYPGDMKQSPEEVAAHLSSSGLIYKSEECGEARGSQAHPYEGLTPVECPQLVGTPWQGGEWVVVDVYYGVFMKAK